MPFNQTPTRTTSDLTEFFLTNIKARIESEQSFANRYVVGRSNDTFNITEQIISDLYSADIVLCDLSGHLANPNVMYELGVRLSVTNKPVILFRESAPENRRIFDIQGFYAFEYSPTRYRELEDHIVTKIRKFETGEELYESPVLKVLRHEPSVVRQMRTDRAANVVRMMASSLDNTHTMMQIVVDEFLHEAYDIDLSRLDTTGALATDDKFKSLDWSAMSFRPQIAPAVLTFLSEPLLADILPPRENEAVTEFVSYYHARFFTVDSIWNKPTWQLITGLLTMTGLFEQALRHLLTFLTATSDTEREQGLRNALDIFQIEQKGESGLTA